MQTGWHEVLVAPHIEEEKAESNADESDQSSRSVVTTRLQRVLARNPSTASTLLGHSSPRFQDISAGSFLEVSPTAFRIAHRIGQLLSNKNSVEETSSLGGCGLIIDYGDDKAFANSFRVSLNYLEMGRYCSILDPRHLKTTKLWMSSTNQAIVI
jgi:NADH dehydrogenase [ubiquinone] 1 alpha subcomplex assembly factor 7